MMRLGIAGRVRVQGTVAEVDAAYRREVQWPQGLRTNPDVRLVLLAAERLVSTLGRETLDRTRTAIVLGSQYGSMASYEHFADGLANGTAAPLAFSHALPCTPVAGMSIRFGLKGPAASLSGGAEVGLAAVRRAWMLLAAGRCDQALVGCWHVPSRTALSAGQPPKADVVLAMLGRRAGGLVADIPDPQAGGSVCTESLADWIDGAGEPAND